MPPILHEVPDKWIVRATSIFQCSTEMARTRRPTERVVVVLDPYVHAKEILKGVKVPGVDCLADHALGAMAAAIFVNVGFQGQ